MCWKCLGWFMSLSSSTLRIIVMNWCPNLVPAQGFPRNHLKLRVHFCDLAVCSLIPRLRECVRRSRLWVAFRGAVKRHRVLRQSAGSHVTPESAFWLSVWHPQSSWRAQAPCLSDRSGAHLSGCCGCLWVVLGGHMVGPQRAAAAEAGAVMSIVFARSLKVLKTVSGGS